MKIKSKMLISNGVKKILLTSILVLFLGFAPHVLAASGFTALAPIPGLTDISNTAVVDSDLLAHFFNNLYKYLIGLAAILAVIEIIWGGFEISTKDSVSKQSDGRERITQAILGLVLVLSPVIVFSIINPSILNLSFNLPALNTTMSSTTPSGAGSGSAATPAVASSSGCSVIGTSGILQIANCPSNDSVQKQSSLCVGNLSIVSQQKLTDGTITSATIMCSWPNQYAFVDTSSSFSLGGIFNTVNEIQPLAITSTNPNNAGSAIQFASICSSAGLTTCISKTPSVSWSTPCVPTPKTSLSGDASRKCYMETLDCRNYGTAHTIIASMCSSKPSWTPFQ
ncbi:MAG: pilin [Candidatus Kaiserbacteria bacterium]|nr:pilin [Candidatus Kaiserbacteria bacterium]